MHSHPGRKGAARIGHPDAGNLSQVAARNRAAYSADESATSIWRPEMATGEGSAATIGKSVQIHGEVKGSEDLVVDGTIEGTITLSESRLTIGPNAHVKANVAARDVILLGALVGDISATGRVELR